MNAPPPLSESPGLPQPRSTFFTDSRGRLRPGLRALFFLLPGFFIFILLDGLLLGAVIHRLSFVTGLTISRSVITLVLLLLSWAYLRGLDRRSFRALGLWFYNGWGRELAWGAALGLAMMALIVAVLVAGRSVTYSGFNGGASELSLIALRLLALFLAGAAAEEVLFRGYGFQRLVDSIGAIGAVTVLSAFFGAVHILNDSATVLSTANTVLAGVLFSLTYLRTRALWLPLGLHWAWNFFQGEIFSLPVSGFTFAKPMFHAVAVGPAWFTGGSYGPEGGLAVTVVLLAGILWLARTRRLAPSPAMREVLE